jgi:hypothetical protein
MSSELETLFSSAARVEMLRLFLLNPGSQYYQREIERETGQPIRAVQREVKRLEELGLLSHSTEGNRVFYRVNPDFALLAELTMLVERAAGVEGVESGAGVGRSVPPVPSTIRQPFPWMQTPPLSPLPPALRRLQVEGEWDRAY